MSKRFKDKIQEDRAEIFKNATKAAYNLLTESESHLLNQFFVEGLSMEQLMEWHSLSEATIKEKYHLALNKLITGVNAMNERLKEHKILQTEYYRLRDKINGLVGNMNELTDLVRIKEGKDGIRFIDTLEVQKMLSQDINDLPITQRLKNIAKANDLRTLEELLSIGKRNIYGLRRMGRRSVDDIVLFLEGYGIKWTNGGVEY